MDKARVRGAENKAENWSYAKSAGPQSCATASFVKRRTWTGMKWVPCSSSRPTHSHPFFI
jgi:hypothetical protein